MESAFRWAAMRAVVMFLFVKTTTTVLFHKHARAPSKTATLSEARLYVGGSGGRNELYLQQRGR